MNTFDKNQPQKYCRTCEHRQRRQCGGKVFQYCAVRRSRRTNNGLLKIRCKDEACHLYEVANE